MQFIESLAHTTPLFAYLAVFFLMISNGIVNFPSSQFLYIFTGYLTSYGVLSIYLIALFGALGNTIGNILQYELVRSKGVAFATRHFSVKKKSFDSLNTFVEKHGAIYLFIGKLIPGLKVTVPIVAGLTRIPRIFVYIILLTSSFIWAIVFTHIGLLFGKDSPMTKWYTLVSLFITLSIYVYTYLKYPHLFREIPKTK
jgi:membrane protein DedA with SNARE-associated domain